VRIQKEFREVTKQVNVVTVLGLVLRTYDR